MWPPPEWLYGGIIFGAAWSVTVNRVYKIKGFNAYLVAFSIITFAVMMTRLAYGTAS